MNKCPQTIFINPLSFDKPRRGESCGLSVYVREDHLQGDVEYQLVRRPRPLKLHKKFSPAPYQGNRCQGITKLGTQCKLPCGSGEFCGIHNPNISRIRVKNPNRKSVLSYHPTRGLNDE